MNYTLIYVPYDIHKKLESRCGPFDLLMIQVPDELEVGESKI